MRILTTTKEVFDALGGVAAVAAMTERDYNAAQNWNSFGSFPPNTYVVMNEALRAKSLGALPSLWRMVGVQALERRMRIVPVAPAERRRARRRA